MSPFIEGQCRTCVPKLVGKIAPDTGIPHSKKPTQTAALSVDLNVLLSVVELHENKCN